MHISIKVQVRLPRRMHRQRVRRDPPLKQRSVIPLPKVDQPNLDIVLLARESVVLPKLLELLRPIRRLRRTVRIRRVALHQLARRAVENHARRAQVVSKLQEHMRRPAIHHPSKTHPVGEEERHLRLARQRVIPFYMLRPAKLQGRKYVQRMPRPRRLSHSLVRRVVREHELRVRRHRIGILRVPTPCANEPSHLIPFVLKVLVLALPLRNAPSGRASP